MKVNLADVLASTNYKATDFLTNLVTLSLRENHGLAVGVVGVNSAGVEDCLHSSSTFSIDIKSSNINKTSHHIYFG